ncbi:PAS domain S-box-containing protein/diguanylate cyclase (GGDEF)-like protein [Paenibacillus taihuensis]|uniref:PAS domain S-box-containing protein/diguanylate cyclase (GGDEF)-like protein n=1 Tax=Paenibacillus taihuensis TaxID=1156355 RepID=A0A3D9RM48_9BACL|nr:GGDEF domain-containing phosphodiesterase [Paenibacillus taihuensis]REE80979.1 PAS domain S-box-containing protein/diguanylate cyclase (GGDEF)-like protein [Paenibacillus taihuensis]
MHNHGFHLHIGQMLDGISDTVFIMKVDGMELTYYYINRAATRLTGITMAEAGKTFFEFYEKNAPMADYLYRKYIRVLTERTVIRYEDGVVMPNGTMSGETVLSPIYDETGHIAYIFSITRDITDRKNYENLLIHYAYHDDLCLLHNRRYLLEQLGSAEALFLLDLDSFKNINDTFGHDAGDAVLIEAATRLHGAFGPEYTLVRLGGDEFIVAASKQVSPVETAVQIMQLFQPPFVVLEQQLKLSVSVGVAARQNDEDIPTLLKQADIALYKAKGAGRKGYHIYESTSRYAHVENFIHELALANAIEQEEFELYYQLIYSPQQEQVVGAEALLRWNRAGAGVVSPADFIPITEQTGLIIPIGYWVIQKACRDWHQLTRHYGSGFKVSVNISSVQLSEPDFVERVIEIARNEGVPAHGVELELTESSVIHNFQQVEQTLDRLRAVGFTIALDDFGTGYSSLSMLTSLPVDKLKIDRSFIRDMNQSLFSAMLMMAAALDMKVIAEGVEDAAQYQMLKEMKCWGLQGYLINKPIALELLVQQAMPQMQ